MLPLSEPVDPEIVGRIAAALDEPVSDDVINRIITALASPEEATIPSRISAALDQPVDSAIVARISNAIRESDIPTTAVHVDDAGATIARTAGQRVDDVAAKMSQSAGKQADEVAAKMGQSAQTPPPIPDGGGKGTFAGAALNGIKRVCWNGWIRLAVCGAIGLGAIGSLPDDTPSTAPGKTSPTTSDGKLLPVKVKYACDADGDCKEVDEKTETESVPPPDSKDLADDYKGRARRAYDDLTRRLGQALGGGAGAGAGGGGLQGLLQQIMGLLGGQGAGSGSAPTTGTASLPQTSPPAVFRFSCEPETVLNKTTATISWACSDSLRSVGIGFATKGIPSGSVQHIVDTASSSIQYGISCGESAPRMCTVNVLHPTLTLAAVPAEVESGGKARIHWAGVEVSECALLGPNGQELGRGGAIDFADTPALTRSTEFIVVCSTKVGRPAYEYVPVMVEGDTGAPVKSTVPFGFMGAPTQSGGTMQGSGSLSAPTTQGGSQTTTGPQTGTGLKTGTSTPPGTYAATDAQGNTVYLCNPDVADIDQFIYCLTGGQWYQGQMLRPNNFSN